MTITRLTYIAWEPWPGTPENPARPTHLSMLWESRERAERHAAELQLIPNITKVRLEDETDGQV